MKNPDEVWSKVRCPGLSPHAGEVFRLGRSIPRKLAAFQYKQDRAVLWVVLIGGTGTGKSTIFNALCGETLSQAGIERPKTGGPIVFAHETAAVETGFPLRDVMIERIPREDLAARFKPGILGGEGLMVLIEHRDRARSHLVLVDTPDLDSLEAKNRRVVDDLMLLADVVLFVTSQEKYADEVPFNFLKRFHGEGKNHCFVLNKAENFFDRDEAMEAFAKEGISWREDHVFVLPYLGGDPGQGLRAHPRFVEFQQRLNQLFSPHDLERFLAEARRKQAGELRGEIERLLGHLKEERKGAEEWVRRLQSSFQAACDRLFQQQRERVTHESRQYIYRQIRKHFSRYDLLRGPRRFIADLVRAPLKLLGLLGTKREESHEEALARIRRQIDMAPLEVAIESFNREVLEKLSPQDSTSLLFKSLRQKEIVLTRSEIRELVYKEQDLLVQWLEDRFETLAKGLPRSKQWGIHSASILGGAVIITLEALIGGGITMLEAVLGSALAPFITKGAVEIFAHRELRQIARQLSRRYEDGLVSVMEQQRARYEYCVRSLLVNDETRKEMEHTLSAVMKTTAGHPDS